MSGTLVSPTENIFKELARLFFYFLLLIATRFPVEIILADASQFGTQDAMVTKVHMDINYLLKGELCHEKSLV